MPRNTFILVIVLAIFAAVVVGINLANVGKKQSNQTARTLPDNPKVSPTPIPLTWNSAECGVSVTYPGNFGKLEAPNGVFFSNPQDAKDVIVLTCQKDIPLPALGKDKIDDVKVGSISAKLYHDAQAKDGTPIDKLIFTQPKTKMDIYIAGLGDSFTRIAQSVHFYP